MVASKLARRRVFRCFFSGGLNKLDPNYNPNGIISVKEFSRSILAPYTSLPAGDHDQAWSQFSGVLLTYNRDELRDEQLLIDWAYVRYRYAQAAHRGTPPFPILPPQPLDGFYRKTVRPLVLLWLREVELQCWFRSSSVKWMDGALEARPRLRSPDLPENRASLRKLVDLIYSIPGPKSSFQRRREAIIANADPAKNLQAWIATIARTEILRRIVRDLPPHAAQFLLEIIEWSLKRGRRNNVLLIKLLQDVSHYTNTFPTFALVSTQPRIVPGDKYRGTEALIDRAEMRDVGFVVIKKPKDVGRRQSQRETWAAQQKQTRELLLWWQLSQLGTANIVKLLGVFCLLGESSSRQLCSIMPQHTPLNIYLRNKRGKDKEQDTYEFSRSMCGVANGLRELHRRGIAHGDLHWGNILVNEDRPFGAPFRQADVLLCDFGMMRIVHQEGNSTSIDPWPSHCLGFMPPELAVNPLEGREIRPGFEVDAYSFAKTVYALAVLGAPRQGPLGSEFPREMSQLIGMRRSYTLWNLLRGMTIAKPSARLRFYDRQNPQRGAVDGIFALARGIM